MAADWVQIVTGGGAVALMTGIGAIIKGAMDAKRVQRQDTQSAEASLREELRGLLASERAQFEKELGEMRAEVATLRSEVRALSGRVMNLVAERERLRAAINYHERTQGLPVTVWPDDGGNP